MPRDYKPTPQAKNSPKEMYVRGYSNRGLFSGVMVFVGLNDNETPGCVHTPESQSNRRGMTINPLAG